MKAPLAMAAAAVLLSGCVPSPAPPQQIDLTGRDCAAAPSLAGAAPLLYSDKDQTVAAPFTATDPCVRTPTGLALYHVFRLPDGASQLTFTVASPPAGLALVPIHVVLLDNTGAVKREYAGDALAFRGGGLSALFRGHPDEAYLVVEADPGAVGQSVSRTQETTATSTASSGRFFFSVHTGSDSTTSYTFTQLGNVTIMFGPTVPPKKE
jgi:hypothetical protein